MRMEDLKLSSAGIRILKSAIRRTKAEYKNYSHIRTCFYFLSEKKDKIQSITLRNFIEETLEQYQLKSPYQSGKDSDYRSFVNNKFFDVLSMQLHRLHPDHYAVVTFNSECKIITIIRDRETSKTSNYKLTWQDNSMKIFEMETVAFHLMKNQLEG